MSVGVVAIDGTKMAANASSDANRDFGQIAREILAEAARRPPRGRALRDGAATSCPSSCAPAKARRQALREAKELWRASAAEAPRVGGPAGAPRAAIGRTVRRLRWSKNSMARLARRL